MNSNQLGIFLCVADCGSFTKAAEKLYLSTTAVMKQMNLLERDISLQLLERTNRGIQLTAAGKSLYKDGRMIDNYVKESVLRARKAMQDNQYIIRVGTSLLNPCKALMELWSQLSDQYPQFKIQIIPFEDDHNNLLNTMDAVGRDFDFIVGVCGSSQWLSRVNFYELEKVRVCCAVSRSHRLASKPLLEYADLYGETLMMVKQGDSPHLDCLREEIVKKYPQIQIEDTPYFYDIDVFNHCEQTGGNLLTLENWADIHFSLITIPVNWDHMGAYGLIYPKKPSTMVLHFLEAIAKVKGQTV